MPQQVQTLNSAERTWVHDNLALASSLATKYAGSSSELPPLPVLGKAFAAWAVQPVGEREDPNEVINALGMALGEHLARGLSLEWVVVTDEHGTDLALHGDPGDMLLFPLSSTAKRYETQEYEFFEWFYDMIREDIQQRRQEG